MRFTRTLYLLPLLLLAPLAGQITLNTTPTRVIGQDSTQVEGVNPNLVEGREFDTPLALVLDTSTNPPGLYVSDTANNRVLGFKSAVGFANGQKADVVVGQLDFTATFSHGPGTTLITGLSTPTGIAVDAAGNLYVIDTANNRILRFPKPLTQTGPPLPDIVIGQTTFSAGSANQGGTAPSSSSLAFTIASGTTTTPLAAYLTFDSQGNLWVADAGNNRVLRFNASVLGAQAASGPVADIVLGQTDFINNTYNPSASPLTQLNGFTTPTGIAFDAAGRLFIDESISTRRGRILMYNPPFNSGQAASRILGVDPNSPPAISEFQVSISPGALFPVGNSIGVADTVDNRILVFPPVEQWTPNTTYQAAIEVAGQPDFTSGSVNQGLPTPTAGTLAQPQAAAFFGNELYVADTGNNRVVVMPQNGTSFGPATSVLGQDAMNLNSPNLIEGREFNLTGDQIGGSLAIGPGLAVDLNSTPPHLYVADTANNRILGYNDLRNLKPGQKADIVIGQPNFQQALINYPTNIATTPNASGLFAPLGIIVDPQGNLYVADAGNSRVLRFPQPFVNYVAGAMESADLVLGQSGFTATKITDALPQTMSIPYGLALTTNPGLLVSDFALNRVLYFKGTSADFSSGMSATTVFGQPDFTSSGAGSSASQLNGPRHISVDLEDRLYVADSGNARISIFASAPGALPGEPAAQTLTADLTAPVGMYVSPTTNDIWVGDAGSSSTSGAAIRFSPFNAFVTAGFSPNAIIPDAFSPRAVVQDAWGDLFVADAANRVVVYYPAVAPLNGASFLGGSLLAPGMIASAFSLGNDNQFGGQPTSAPAGQFPLPTTLNGIQVLFNNAPVRLFYADPNQINFLVPAAAPQNGTADLQVLDTATGRVLGDSTIQMNTVFPGLFTDTGNGMGTVAALNQDGSINSPTNPATQGDVIVMFGTGQGFIAGAPADGYPATAVQTAAPPIVLIGGFPVDPSAVQYSGLAPGLVGVWQINVVIPATTITLPTNPTFVYVQQGSFISGVPLTGRGTEIYVKAKS